LDVQDFPVQENPASAVKVAALKGYVGIAPLRRPGGSGMHLLRLGATGACPIQPGTLRIAQQLLRGPLSLRAVIAAYPFGRSPTQGNRRTALARRIVLPPRWRRAGIECGPSKVPGESIVRLKARAPW
jgi:hypothetical protein